MAGTGRNWCATHPPGPATKGSAYFVNPLVRRAERHHVGGELGVVRPVGVSSPVPLSMLNCTISFPTRRAGEPSPGAGSGRCRCPSTR